MPGQRYIRIGEVKEIGRLGDQYSEGANKELAAEPLGQIGHTICWRWIASNNMCRGRGSIAKEDMMGEWRIEKE